MTTIVETLLLFKTHILVAGFVLAMFGGEPAVLVLGFLTAQSIIPIPEVLLIGYSSALIAEIFWFWVARSSFANFLAKRFFSDDTHKGLLYYAEKVERGNPLRLFMIARFVSGLTLVVLFYLSRKGTPFKTFVYYCLIVNAVWTPLIVLFGWMSGKGFTLIMDTFESIKLALGVAVFFAVLLFFGYKTIGGYILKKKIK